MSFELPLKHPAALYVGGEFVSVDSAAREEVVNPSTEEVIGLAPVGGERESRDAIAAARHAYDHGPWPRMSPRQRAEHLARLRDLLIERAGPICELITLEAGSIHTQTRGRQFDIPMKHFDYFLEAGQQIQVKALAPELTQTAKGKVVGTGFVVREPVGVVSAITPYNYPFFLNVIKIVPALMTGNTCVLKPSPFTPFEAMVLAEAAHDAGLPPGVLNVVTGGKEVGELLTTHPDVDMVTFTGSDTVGAAIAGQCAPGLKRVLLELGGKSALIVRQDADLDLAVANALRGFTSHAGQGCAMNTRSLVHNSIRGEFARRLAEQAKAVRVGDTLDPTSQMGPLIRAAARDRTERYVAMGLESGAKLLSGGQRPAHLDRGFFYNPTLFDDVDNRSGLAQEEIFGPIGVIIGFDSDDEAVSIANDSNFGLRGGIISADLGRAYEMALQIRSGGVTLNGGAGTQLSNGPFGGIKRSGYGRELGEEGLHEYTQQKLIEIHAG
ncbi:MAG: aldehyde dehydrogenase family protein [Pseudomonas sp.]|uniref:aldehyde dehydrogenase family protein n=1 Tax=Pseudomonas sp. TaxID=306 RepID=UPI0039829954